MSRYLRVVYETISLLTRYERDERVLEGAQPFCLCTPQHDLACRYKTKCGQLRCHSGEWPD